MLSATRWGPITTSGHTDSEWIVAAMSMACANAKGTKRMENEEQ